MGLFGKLTQLFGHESQAPLSEEDRLLDHVVNMTETSIATVPGYQDQLAPAIENAQSYFEQALNLVPGPVPLDIPSPRLSLMFPTLADLSAALGRSLTVKQNVPVFEAEGHERIYALLGMRTKIAQEGGLPYLADHTLTALSTTAAGVRKLLAETAFNSLLKGFASGNRYQQQKLELAISQKELLQEAHAQSGRKAKYSGVSQSLDAHISRASHSLTADKILTELVDDLGAPENHLRLNNRNGYTLKDSSTSEGESLFMPLMSSQDRRQWLVCLVEFPLIMAKDALASESHCHRFILI